MVMFRGTKHILGTFWDANNTFWGHFRDKEHILGAFRQEEDIFSSSSLQFSVAEVIVRVTAMAVGSSNY